MLSRSEAERIAAAEVDRMTNGEARLVTDATLELPYGWVFFWNGVAFLETGDPAATYLGNAPLLVDKETGALHLTGTAYPVAHYLREHEERRGLRAPAGALTVVRALLRGIRRRLGGRSPKSRFAEGTDCTCLKCRIGS